MVLENDQSRTSSLFNVFNPKTIMKESWFINRLYNAEDYEI